MLLVLSSGRQGCGALSQSIPEACDNVLHGNFISLIHSWKMYLVLVTLSFHFEHLTFLLAEQGAIFVESLFPHPSNFSPLVTL